MDRIDPRVTEIKLLRERDTIVDTDTDTGPADGNLLVVGDAHDALLALTRIPEYADELRGKVKLVYIDPPFNTGQAFIQYDDALRPPSRPPTAAGTTSSSPPAAQDDQSVAAKGVRR